MLSPDDDAETKSLISPSSSRRVMPRVRMASHQHRVLIYTTCYNVVDGVTLTIRKLEREILDAGHSVCLLTTRSGDMTNTHLVPEHPHRTVLFVDNAVPIPFVHDPHQPEVSYQLGFSLSRAVKEQIEAFEPSIVHITCPDCTALHLLQLCRQREWPVMGTYHSNIPEYMNHYPGLTWLKHILGEFFCHQYSFLQALYVPTPFIRQHLVQQYQMDQCTTVGIWGRGVDTTHYHPDHSSDKFRSAILSEKNQALDTPILLWVGRLVPEKRVDIFCDTVRRLAAAGVEFHALVVGAGTCQDDVQDLPNTTFAGWMDADQLAVAYASADAFMFPSAVETFGNVTLEAMASGLPVIVDAGCSGHLVQDGRNGFAIPTPDHTMDEAAVAEAYYQAAHKLLTDTPLRQEGGLASRELAETMEQHVVVRRMLDNYATVTDEFYVEYEGHHAQRDELWALQHNKSGGAFRGGNHPRPLLLVLVEYIFIVLFQVLWNMTALFAYVHDMTSTLIRRRPQHPPSSTSAPEWTAVPTVDSTKTKRKDANVVSDALSVILEDSPSRSRSNSSTGGLSSRSASPLQTTRKALSSRTNKQANGDRTALIDMDSIDLEQDVVQSTDPSVLPLKTPSSRCEVDEDEATNSTTSSTQDHTDSSSLASFWTTCSSNTASNSNSSQKKVAFGDCQLSHVLAKGFVRSMAFQMRMESRMRNSARSSWSRWQSSSTSSSGTTTSFLRGSGIVVGKKRKSSSFTQSDLSPELDSSRNNNKSSTTTTRRGRSLLDTNDDITELL